MFSPFWLFFSDFFSFATGIKCLNWKTRKTNKKITFSLQHLELRERFPNWLYHKNKFSQQLKSQTFRIFLVPMERLKDKFATLKSAATDAPVGTSLWKRNLARFLFKPQLTPPKSTTKHPQSSEACHFWISFLKFYLSVCFFEPESHHAAPSNLELAM